MDSGKNIGFKQANGNMPQQKNPSKSFRVASSPGAELINERRKPTTTAPDNLFLSVSGRGLKTSLYLLHTWSRSFHQAFLSAHLLFIYLFLFPLSLPTSCLFYRAVDFVSCGKSSRRHRPSRLFLLDTTHIISILLFCTPIPSSPLPTSLLNFILIQFNLNLKQLEFFPFLFCQQLLFSNHGGMESRAATNNYFHSLWIGRYFLLLIN